MDKYNKKKSSKSNKKKLLFFLFVKTIIITSLVILLFSLLFLYLNRKNDKKTNLEIQEISTPNKSNKDMYSNNTKQLNKNIAVFGVDKGEGRTDTILVININSNNSKISIVSIPRDTKLTWTEEQKNKAIELNRNYRSTSKITDMSSLGGIENIRDFTICSIEDLLDIKIDNYAIINTKIVRNVVEAVGGVTFNVPRVMKYTDTYQGLYIDLQPGLQTLNGEQAEGLLRWRHNNDYSEQYAKGDEGRIETQQLFIKTFTNQILSPNTFKNLPHLVETIYKDVKTDMNLFEILTYIPYLKDVSSNMIYTSILPGEAVKENHIWYYIIDDQALPSFINNTFYVEE